VRAYGDLLGIGAIGEAVSRFLLCRPSVRQAVRVTAYDSARRMGDCRQVPRGAH
jgi:hypothetical protein